MSQINFEDETLDASDGVTKLLLAAEYWKEKASALRAELDALKRQEPVAWMKDQWSPDCGNYWELCREDEMGWRDRKDRVPLYLTPGAQPAPSVPECPYPCGWRNLLALAIEDGAYLARSINEDEPVTENARAVTMRMVMRLRDVLMAINKAAPEKSK